MNALAKLSINRHHHGFKAVITYTIHAAKTHLSRLIEQARAGEEIIIAKDQEPMVRLVPIEAGPQRRVFGAMRGKAAVTDAFFEPLPPAELQAWEG